MGSPGVLDSHDEHSLIPPRSCVLKQSLSQWNCSRPASVLSTDIVTVLIEEMTLLVTFILPNGEYRMALFPVAKVGSPVLIEGQPPS